MGNVGEGSWASVNGARMHYIRRGRGPTLLLLHGFPEFSATWAPVIARLEGDFTLIAPDLRGFGRSLDSVSGPSDQIDRVAHAADVIALADALSLDRFGIVSHDVGAYVAQEIGQTSASKLTKLFFFNCPYPGIGQRWCEPDYLRESWYQYIQQLPWAADLVGTTPQTIRAYIGHLLRHWSHRKDAFDGVLDEWVENYSQPGALQGSFNWYLSNNRYRIAMMRGQVAVRPPIAVPTCVRWGDDDAVSPVSWADKLPEYFTDLDFAAFPEAGHFPHMEWPDKAAAEIKTFFGG